MRRRIRQLFSSALSTSLDPVASGQPSALRITVRDAWLAHERYAGQQVTITGVVQVFEAGTPGEYFTLDEGPNRIGLRGDAALLRARVGQRATATGLLSFKPGVGIFLDAGGIEEDCGLRAEG